MNEKNGHVKKAVVYYPSGLFCCYDVIRRLGVDNLT